MYFFRKFRLSGRVLLGVVVASFIVCYFIYFVFYRTPHNESVNVVGQNSVLQQSTDNLFLGLHGKVLLSLRGSNKKEYGMYTVDLNTGDLNKFMVDDGDNLSYLDGQFSDDGSVFVFVSEDASTSEVYMSDKDIQNIIQVTNSNKMVKRSPQVSSNNNVVVYQSLNSDVGISDAYMAKNWEIHLVYVSTGEDRYLANGINPVFINDEIVLFAKNDGLYLLNPNEEKINERIILFYDNPVNLSMKFFVSDDLTHLIVSDGNDVRIYSVTDWEKMDMLPSPVVLNMHMHEVVLLGDNKYIVGQTLVENDASDLIVFNLSSDKHKEILNLNDFLSADVLISDLF